MNKRGGPWCSTLVNEIRLVTELFRETCPRGGRR